MHAARPGSNLDLLALGNFIEEGIRDWGFLNTHRHSVTDNGRSTFISFFFFRWRSSHSSVDAVEKFESSAVVLALALPKNQEISGGGSEKQSNSP